MSYYWPGSFQDMPGLGDGRKFEDLELIQTHDPNRGRGLVRTS